MRLVRLNESTDTEVTKDDILAVLKTLKDKGYKAWDDERGGSIRVVHPKATAYIDYDDDHEWYVRRDDGTTFGDQKTGTAKTKKELEDAVYTILRTLPPMIPNKSDGLGTKSSKPYGFTRNQLRKYTVEEIDSMITKDEIKELEQESHGNLYPPGHPGHDPELWSKVEYCIKHDLLPKKLDWMQLSF